MTDNAPQYTGIIGEVIVTASKECIVYAPFRGKLSEHHSLTAARLKAGADHINRGAAGLSKDAAVYRWDDGGWKRHEG